MKKNYKEEFIDDGRTIAKMDVDGMPGVKKKETNRLKEYDVTKSEKWHMILASYKAYLPILICGLVGMTLAMLLISSMMSTVLPTPAPPNKPILPPLLYGSRRSITLIPV